ncbi:hypothetical protein E2C01_030137 [Portunus trituberculatus]|uniref:Uncharacterized protein n=1 Tax=Portunus trituberculatus TaxID=210409 RepID=A0A5B7EPP0_PORTR|nr:hypothetical protein [Portunus trituberculatus]
MAHLTRHPLREIVGTTNSYSTQHKFNDSTGTTLLFWHKSILLHKKETLKLTPLLFLFHQQTEDKVGREFTYGSEDRLSREDHSLRNLHLRGLDECWALHDLDDLDLLEPAARGRAPASRGRGAALAAAAAA